MKRDYNSEKLHIWYIDNNDEAVAAIMLKEMEDNIGKIENVCCHEQFRGKGLAQKILDQVIKYAKEINITKLRLGTYDSLQRAIGFYRKNGFVEKEEEYNEQQKARYYEKLLN